MLITVTCRKRRHDGPNLWHSKLHPHPTHVPPTCHFISQLHTPLSPLPVLRHPRCGSAVWDAFQIPLSLSYQPVPAARLVFTLSQAPPCHHGDAAVTCQFHGGDAHRPVMAQNRIVGEFFAWKWGERNTKSPRGWTVEQEKNFNYMGMWHMCAWRLQGVVHGSDWLLPQRGTLSQTVLVRPHVLASQLVHSNVLLSCVWIFVPRDY